MVVLASRSGHWRPLLLCVALSAGVIALGYSAARTARRVGRRPCSRGARPAPGRWVASDVPVRPTGR
jgi:hypothetical protein